MMMLVLDEQLDLSASLEFRLSSHLGTTSCPVGSSSHHHHGSQLEEVIVEDVCGHLAQGHLHATQSLEQLVLWSMSDPDIFSLTD
jgi:hypothetical protein